ncbi:nitroreductase family protein [Streptomyces sp. DSM 42041]|uniref:Nitroreductase family protein n=1 Tax=Streptomyces hazeniae TaxID=3075538 RepID=A0ABU2NST1_9ACTN|nr:nitroreductase family protein [Streptomyces sp. DSM 42041]MDT0379671.1 nitroreductase family protein [Streptomyces sp. DSM 42041]
MGLAHDYATAILHRGRVPMDPADFVPDWADGPRKGKHYPGVDRLPLPAGGYPADAHVDRGLAAAQPAGPDDGFDLDALSGMLRDSYGLTGRRLAVQANTDLNALPFYPLANWSRGSASGGGLYPVSIHWVSGTSGPVTPGLHYYSTRHHAMHRLLTGDVTGEVRAALGGDGAPGADADHYLVLGVKYWQNAFKYNNFCFHVVSMDLGALVQTWRIWARARGLEVEPLLWFDEERMARLLGVEGDAEGVFAVVPLRWRRTEDSDPDAGPQARTPRVAPAPAAVRHRDVEKSRRLLAFDDVRAMHEATLGRAEDRPAPGALESAAAHAPDASAALRPLPAPRPLEADVRTALRRRRSSFGRFDARRPVTADQLAATLAAADAGARLGGDCSGGPGGGSPVRLARTFVFVNHVEDVAPGSYLYDPEAGGLRPVREGKPGSFLQENYFLSNYNLEQAGAVLVPTVRTHAVLDAVGDRGYRLVGATVGAVSQAVYTAAAALDLGCGVALGFDNVSYTDELGLAGTDEAPLLIMMIGHERPEPAAFHFEIA